MCGGGDDSGGNDNETGMSPGESQARYGNTNAAGKTASDKTEAEAKAKDTPNVTTATDRDQFVSDALSAKGYSDNYKGVGDSKGNAVTDGNGNPVRSGDYAQTEAEAGAVFDAYQDYKEERAKAESKFMEDTKSAALTGRTISDDLLDRAAGLDPDDFTKTISAEEQAAAQRELGELMGNQYDTYGNVVGMSNQFDDQLGPYGAPSMMDFGKFAGGSSLLGSNISQKDSFKNVSEGFNDGTGFLGTNFESDVSGNLGFSSPGQRFGDFVGGSLLGMLGSAVAGPVGGAIASGLQPNTMDLYGTNFTPGYGATVSELSFNPGAALGNFLGGEVAGAVAPEVAGAVYDSTGNVNTAIGAGVGAGVLGSQLGQQGGTLAAKGMGITPSVVSSDIQASPYQDQVDDMMEAQGFGSRVDSGGDDGGTQSVAGSAMPTSNIGSSDPNMGTAVGDTEIQTVDSGDVGSGTVLPGDSTAEFDADAFINETAQLSNPNTQQLVSLFGDAVNDLNLNPLFSAAPAGVQYLSKGRQRQYGNAIYNVQNKLRNQAGARRRQLGDRLVGMII